jgi:hypothetical protein
MENQKVVVVGGGAAGFFAAIRCAELNPRARVTILEQGPRFLSKVRISGGGRCNVTHACFDPRQFAQSYPRGVEPLKSLLHRFQARDCVEWFESRGVGLKTEADGRMFPATDSSETIVDCLMTAAEKAGVKLLTKTAVDTVAKKHDGRLHLALKGGETEICDRLLLATGGCRSNNGGQLAASLGHTIEPPVPSLFTFHVDAPWLRLLAGISLPSAEVSVRRYGLRENGPILITHSGLSGPAILRLSAWGARELNSVNYQFQLTVNWVAMLNEQQVIGELDAKRASNAARLMVNTPIAGIPGRLWEVLVMQSGVARETRWSQFSRVSRHNLVQGLMRMDLQVVGKTLNQDEFVTCGGVRLAEIDSKTMRSRICAGLYFAGELLDIDGITGGFNFQAAWTTGWIAGGSMANVD